MAPKFLKITITKRVDLFNLIYMLHRHWIIISGTLWVIIGALLLKKGFFYTQDPFWVVPAFILGALKAKFIFSKTVDKFIQRILKHKPPIHIKHVYPLPYLFLILFMMGLGFLLKFTPNTIHGFVDIAVGAALILGGINFFKKLP